MKVRLQKGFETNVQSNSNAHETTAVPQLLDSSCSWKANHKNMQIFLNISLTHILMGEDFQVKALINEIVDRCIIELELFFRLALTTTEWNYF